MRRSHRSRYRSQADRQRRTWLPVTFLTRSRSQLSTSPILRDEGARARHRAARRDSCDRPTLGVSAASWANRQVVTAAVEAGPDVFNSPSSVTYRNLRDPGALLGRRTELARQTSWTEARGMGIGARAVGVRVRRGAGGSMEARGRRAGGVAVRPRRRGHGRNGRPRRSGRVPALVLSGACGHPQPGAAAGRGSPPTPPATWSSCTSRTRTRSSGRPSAHPAELIADGTLAKSQELDARRATHPIRR
jgi:hypothetical protein